MDSNQWAVTSDQWAKGDREIGGDKGINRKAHYDIFFTEEREEHEGVKHTLCDLGDLFVRKGSDEGFSPGLFSSPNPLRISPSPFLC